MRQILSKITTNNLTTFKNLLNQASFAYSNVQLMLAAKFKVNEFDKQDYRDLANKMAKEGKLDPKHVKVIAGACYLVDGINPRAILDEITTDDPEKNSTVSVLFYLLKKCKFSEMTFESANALIAGDVENFIKENEPIMQDQEVSEGEQAAGEGPSTESPHARGAISMHLEEVSEKGNKTPSATPGGMQSGIGTKEV